MTRVVMSGFSEALTEYLRPIAGELSERSQERLERGHVMRILDSNDKHDIAALRDAPRLEVRSRSICLTSGLTTLSAVVHRRGQQGIVQSYSEYPSPSRHSARV